MELVFGTEAAHRPQPHCDISGFGLTRNKGIFTVILHPTLDLAHSLFVTSHCNYLGPSHAVDDTKSRTVDRS